LARPSLNFRTILNIAKQPIAAPATLSGIDGLPVALAFATGTIIIGSRNGAKTATTTIKGAKSILRRSSMPR
jgi:hypothetical protein